MPHFPALPALLFLIFSGNAHAQERSEEQCLRLHPEIMSPVEMVSCSWDITGSTKSMNSALKNLSNRLPEEQRPLLEDVQRAWVSFRDAECVWRASGTASNTINSSDIIACTADMNRARAKHLESELRERQ